MMDRSGCFPFVSLGFLLNHLVSKMIAEFFDSLGVQNCVIQDIVSVF